jgi:UDP-GlcNAc:undecaprenyl-phosphate GlcNAc-1-phosphate transferase
MAAALGLVLAGLLSALLSAPVAAVLAPALSAKNYRGQLIPTGLGLVLLLAVLGGLGGLSLLGWLEKGNFYLAAFWLTLVTLAGLVDDVAGNEDSRGFRGHFAALLRGRLTTGMAKVLMVSGGALAVADLGGGWPGLVEFGVLMLAVNLFNQLDLRPGRALKSFLLMAAVLIPVGSLPAAVGCGGALGMLRGDLQARYMLGDTGANLLGALLGLALVGTLEIIWLCLALILLVLANALGEFFSFSRLIAANRVLLWLDQLGRPGAGE